MSSREPWQCKSLLGILQIVTAERTPPPQVLQSNHYFCFLKSCQKMPQCVFKLGNASRWKWCYMPVFAVQLLSPSTAGGKGRGGLSCGECKYVPFSQPHHKRVFLVAFKGLWEQGGAVLKRHKWAAIHQTTWVRISKHVLDHFMVLINFK